MIDYSGRFEWAYKEKYLLPPIIARLKKYEVKKRMTYAIFETGGKQYRVKEGDVLFIEKLPAEADEKVTFDKVLAVTNEEETKFGSPYVSGAAIDAAVVKNGKSKKIIVYKMHRRKGYRRKQGHRQPYTKIQIDKITC